MARDRDGYPCLGAILLAAGGSRRLGRSKQMVEIDGRPLVRRQAELLLALQPACVVVVTGAEAEPVRAALAGLAVEYAHNANWLQGMGTSLACGVGAMPERVRGALVLLCDQWKVDLPDLEHLRAAWNEAPVAAVVAAWDGARGSPAILPRALFDRLARLQGDAGARQALKGFRGRQLAVQMPNAAFDLDRPEDLPQRM